MAQQIKTHSIAGRLMTPARGPHNSSYCRSKELLMCAGVDCGLCNMTSSSWIVAQNSEVERLSS